MNLQETYDSLRVRSLGTTIYTTVVSVLTLAFLAICLIGVFIVAAVIDNGASGSPFNVLVELFRTDVLASEKILYVIGHILIVILVVVLLAPIVMNLIVSILGFRYAAKEKQILMNPKVTTNAAGEPLYELPDFTYFKRDAIWKIVIVGLHLIPSITSLNSTFVQGFQDQRFLQLMTKASSGTMLFGVINIVVLVLMIQNLIKIDKWRTYLKTYR